MNPDDLSSEALDEANTRLESLVAESSFLRGLAEAAPASMRASSFQDELAAAMEDLAALESPWAEGRFLDDLAAFMDSIFWLDDAEDASDRIRALKTRLTQTHIARHPASPTELSDLFPALVEILTRSHPTNGPPGLRAATNI
jgi:hypothetical protein